MVSSQKTSQVLRELREAGFTPVRTRGSHTMWKHPSGVGITVPDGHREISPGVYRNIQKAIAQAKEEK